MITKKTKSLADAIWQTVAYADVFDYPVRVDEIHRYLIGGAASAEEIEQIIGEQMIAQDLLESNEHFVFLPGRNHLIKKREHRERYAKRLWRQADRYGRWITHLPFVRMVAVTGALTSNNVEEDADLDYMIITAPGYLWLCRAFILILVRLTESFGAQICPNYLLTSDNLQLTDENLFTAQELCRMIPISGFEVYESLRAANSWTSDHLPNTAGSPQNDHIYDPRFKPLQINGEFMLHSALGNRLEAWEMRRKIEKLSHQGIDNQEVRFTESCCKGHFDQYSSRTLKTFIEKVKDFKGSLV